MTATAALLAATAILGLAAAVPTRAAQVGAAAPLFEADSSAGPIRRTSNLAAGSFVPIVVGEVLVGDVGTPVDVPVDAEIDGERDEAARAVRAVSGSKAGSSSASASSAYRSARSSRPNLRCRTARETPASGVSSCARAASYSASAPR